MPEAVRPSPSEIQRRLEFETLFSDVSASLMAAPPEQLHLAVERALTQVRTFFEADRCILMSVSADQQVVEVGPASYAEGVARVPGDLDLLEAFPWSRQTLIVERAPVRVTRMADLPPEAYVERAGWELMSIRSALTLPIETGGGALHLILLNTVHQEREWPDAFVTRLRVLGEMLVGALERQEMLTGLREAEERMSLAASAAGAGIWSLDPAAGVFWATDSARGIFGYAPDEVVSIERLLASIHADDRDQVRAAMDRSLGAGEPLSVEYRILRDDGCLRWVSSQGRPFFGPAGEPERLMGISMDVTERRLAEDAIHRNEARLAAGAKLAGLGYYEIDYGAGSMTVDEGFCELCGIPPERQQGLQPVDFWLKHLHCDDRERVTEGRRGLHDGRLEQISIEYRYLHPCRGETWIHHLAGVTSRDVEGRVVRTYGVLRDVTSRKQAEDELRGLSGRLIRAQEAERALIARELHDDLTQRLAVLAIDVGRVEGLARDPELTLAMEAVREGLVRLSEDVHALAYRLHPAVLEELGLVEALRAECERLGRVHGPVPSVELADAAVPADRETALCLFRVAQEALQNVIRHAGARTVSIVLQPMDGGLVLAVHDDGVGFDASLGGKEPSLGLASMRERVSLVHGTLDVESAPGQGTSVVAWVPLTDGPR